MLDVADILLLKTVTEAGSINKAADKLYMSQPTLSKRISRLEQVLNVELFYRHSAGMKPTEATIYLIDNGEQIRAKLDSMCRHIELLSNLEGGSLNIGVSSIVEQLFFPKVLMDFVEETRHVEISFQVMKPELLQGAVLSGAIDIAIGPFVEAQLSPELVVTKIKEEPLVFVVRAGHPLADKGHELTVSELNKFPGVGPGMNKGIAQFLSSHGIKVPLTITCDNYQIAKSVVMTSDHFTGGPRELFAKELARKELVVLETDTLVPWTAYCVTRPETLSTPTVKKFIEVLSQYID